MQNYQSNDIVTFIAVIGIGVIGIGVIVGKLFGYFLDVAGFRAKRKAKDLGIMDWKYVVFLIFLIGFILLFVDSIRFVFGFDLFLYQIMTASVFLLGFIIIWKKILKKV